MALQKFLPTTPWTMLKSTNLCKVYKSVELLTTNIYGEGVWNKVLYFCVKKHNVSQTFWTNQWQSTK